MSLSKSKTINLKIREKEYNLNKKCTLITGDFNIEDISPLPYENFFEIIDNFNELPLQRFLMLNEDIKKSLELKKKKKSMDLLSHIKKFQNSIKATSDLIEEYFTLSKSFKAFLKFNLLLKRRERLKNEREISRLKSKSSKIAAKTDLMNKLQKSLKENKDKLNYLEEDYFKLKNRRNQIKDTIREYNSNIKKLNRIKKENFNKINKLTRELSDPTKSDKEAEESLNEISFPVTQRIRTLRMEAKDAHREIKQIKTKLRESQSKLEKLKPSYKQFKKDYEALKAEIERDKEELDSIQKEMEQKLGEEDLKDLDYKELNSVKSEEEILSELDRIEEELKTISNSSEYIQEEAPHKIDPLTTKISDFKKSLTEKKNTLQIQIDDRELIKSIENFRKLESLLNNIKIIQNKFLAEINLEVKLNILITSNYEEFLLSFSYIRSKKEQISFEDLTTPEKVFFVITFFLSFLIQVNSEKVIFSNLILPDEFNKRGSLYRTIRKILPLFKNNPELQKYNLVFVISKLEMKKPIKSIEIIEIEKS